MAFLNRTLRPSPRSPLPANAANCLVIMTTIMSCTLIIANLTGIKIWDPIALFRQFCSWYLNLWPDQLQTLPAHLRLAQLIEFLDPYHLPVDGGIIVFPITYVLGDLLVEIYGQRTANRIATYNLLTELGVCLCLWIIAALPSYPGADNSSFVAISSMASRLFLASLISFWCSQRLNNFIFTLIRSQSAPYAHKFWIRALSSSIFAHLIDAIIFETIAFYGRLPLAEFLLQAVFAFLSGLVLEALLLPLTSRIAKSLEQRLEFTDGHPTSSAT